MSQPPAKIITTADLEINVDTQQVYKNNHLINLTELTFQTLMALVNDSSKVLSSEDLIAQIWQDIEVSPETLTQRIAMLRKALSADGEANDKYIKSIRNKGYRWVPTVIEKNNDILISSKWLLFGLLIVVLISVFYLVGMQSGYKEKLPTHISSQASEDDYIQQAWHYMEKHETKSNQLAIGLFRKSLAINPNHIDALTGLSIALSHAVTKFNQPDTLLIESQQIAELAISINPDHGQAWAALAFVYDAMGELKKAVFRYQKALALNPKDSATASSLAYLYGEQGRLVEALKLNIEALGSRQMYLDLQIAKVLDLLGFDAVAAQWYAKADDLSPDNVFATHLRARYYLSRNQYQEAKKVVDEAIERGVLRPELPLLNGIIAWIQGEDSMALESFEQAVAIDATDIEAQIWLFLIQHPDDTAASLKQNFINQWFMPSYGWPDSWVSQALFYAHFDDNKLALESLNQAYLAGYRNHRWLLQIPVFKALHSNSSWLRLIEKMQNDVSKQRQELLQVDWLPTSFLDPKN